MTTESNRSVRGLAVRYIQFSLSTLAGTAVDMWVLWLCASHLFAGNYVGEYVISPVLSFECAMFTNYALAYFYVWRDRVERPTLRSFLTRLVGYNCSCVGAFLVKMALLLGCERLFHLNVLLCNLCALCFSGLVNFLLNERWVFRRRIS